MAEMWTPSGSGPPAAGAYGSSIPPPPPPPIEPESSPLLPRNLVDLFVRPRRFFTGQLALGKTPYIIVAAWCYGIATSVDRIDQEILKSQLGRSNPFAQRLVSTVTESWPLFWAWVLAIGAINGLLLWLIGGWWYRKRLRWSGAADADKRLARLTYIYSSFVLAGPLVLATLFRTALYPNYAAASDAMESLSVLMLVFPFWSVATSYAGATALFPVSKGRARLWFLILPIVFYVLIVGLVAAALVRFGQPA